MRKSTLAVLLVAATSAAVVLAGCAPQSGGESTAKGEPIIVGSVNALSGPATFAEASQAAKAVFDEFNANGGLDGRPIHYVILDDKGDPSAGTAAARDAVESQGAVAMVGSASLLDCEVNGDYYQEQGIISIPGTGVDPVCFSHPNISPVNAGPYYDSLLTLTYGSEILGLKSICAMVPTTGSQLPAYKAAYKEWTANTGANFTLLDDTVPYGAADYTPQVVKAKQAGCDAIYFSGVEPDGVGILKAAESQGMSDVTFLFLTSVYSEQFAQAASFVGKGLYVPAEFLPYTNTMPGNEDWKTLMDKHSVPLTSFGQGGYLAANHFIAMLKTLKGDVTKETVAAAFRAQTEGYDNPMTGTPWLFGAGDIHGSNTAGWPVKIEPGASVWAQAADDWITSKSVK